MKTGQENILRSLQCMMMMSVKSMHTQNCASVLQGFVDIQTSVVMAQHFQRPNQTTRARWSGWWLCDSGKQVQDINV